MTNFLRLVIAVGVCLVSPLSMFAQATASLNGDVRDPSGAALAGATIQLSNRLTGFERDAATDEHGAFSIQNVPFQTYELTVDGEGFQSHRETLVLRSNVPVRVEVRLRIAAQIETVSVSATESIGLVDTDATGTRTELNLATIERMPVPVGARGLESVLLSFPGFAANANGAIHPRGAHNQMTYVVDGMPISDQFTGSFATSLDPGIVQTIELFTGDIPPEYGNKVSGVANITTRSGLDAGGERFGSSEIGAAEFDTLSTVSQAGGVAGRLGYFGSVSVLKSNRFLDQVVLDNLHNGGNAQRAFTRLDYNLNDRDYLRLNMMVGRSSFQLANLRSQHLAGQQQRRLLRDFSASLGYVRTLDANSTFDSTLAYRTTIAQLTPSAGDTPVTADLARHLSTLTVANRYNVIRGSHNIKLGVDFQHFPVSENFSFGLTDPAFNNPSSPDFNPNLVSFDFTRGGDWFRFSDKRAGNLYTGFFQDRVRWKRFLFSLGGRYDMYRFLVDGNQFQPRVGFAFHLEETGTVFRGSYNRNYQTPPNENLLLANSQQASSLAPPDVRRDLNGGVILMRPQRQNVYEAGIQQSLGDWASLNAMVYHKDSRDLQDNDNFLNTGIIFPTSLAESNVNGAELRLTLPEKAGLSGTLSMTHYHVVVTPPFTGGLFLGSAAIDILSAGPFVIDHDQALGLQGTSLYHLRKNLWTAWSVRHDSGLVSNPSDPAEVAADPDFADQLPYVDLASDPPRVEPRTIVDFSVGYEHIRKDKRRWEIVFQMSNLTNRAALYNFQSVFVGTRVVQPRTAGVRWRWYW